MPYIKKEQRVTVDYEIRELVYKLLEIPDKEIEGVMNYTITTLINQRMKPHTGWRYKWLNRAIGVLEGVKLELYRRIAGPYEDGACEKNGDVY